jgi:hypothetical protein
MLLSLCISILLSDQVQSDVSIPKWVPDTISRLRKEGLLVGYPDGLIYRRDEWKGPTRYEHAVATHASFTYLKNCVQSLRLEISSSSFHPERPDDYTRGVLADLRVVLTWKPLVGDLESLAREFSKELVEMGVTPTFAKDVASYKDRIESLAQSVKRFPDVPKGHWASEAVQSLRRAGIVAGYRDGKFGG